MATEKLEPRLVSMIDDEKRRATARGMTAAAVDREETFDITISHIEPVRADEVDPHARRPGLRDLEERTRERQRTIVERVRRISGEAPIKSHTLATAITTRLTPEQMMQVAELDEVGLIRVEKLDNVAAMNESIEIIEVREAWEELHLTGRGVRVAVLDSGIDANHPALAGKVVEQVSTAGEPVEVPGDHGTHVAGTIASNDPVFKGVAFQANLLNIKVLTAVGSGMPQFVIEGLDHAVRLDANVANLSLGWSESLHGWVCNDADCILCQAADNAARLGVTVVVAAGNEDSEAGPGQFNIRHPGAARRVITVGAVDKAKQLAAFTSIGPSSGRLSPSSLIRLTKPDLAAPGVGIVSAVLGGGFAAFNGTSMACPHVAGVAALALEAHTDARPALIKKLLEDTCERLPYAPDQAGYGLINALSAVMRSVRTK